MNTDKSLLEVENQPSCLGAIICRYFIYVYYQVGNIGSRDVRTIDEQPKDGFETEQEAEQHLVKLIVLD